MNRLSGNQFSIVIVTWNTADITKKCVETINQYLPGQEILVVDNGSQDHTVEILKKIKNVKIIENHANLGFAKANNIGFKQVTNDYLVFMNSDIELIDNSLSKMVGYLKNNSRIGIIGPKFLNPDLTPQASVFPPQTAFNAFREFWLNQKESYSKYIPQTKNPVNVSYISGGCLAISKEFFKKIGGWNEKYFFYFEDMDLCRQVSKFKKNIVFFPQCSIIHRHGASGKNLAPAKDQWRRLIPSSIKFHGHLKHYFINFIIWSGQKWQKIFQK
ncbi:MAG: glycosyltransferase family 2 protein [Candidatus Shapirobacteria bacterium]|nr:glycosyltransferase family 2 protein [Candidatus Shapirobacteria bacterium]